LAKVLPAGANVNLNLGEDPFDRLWKTIQTVSQVQGVMNEATLQRDRREAVKEESFQTKMLNTLSLMDESNMSSVNNAEGLLKQLRDQFVTDNPQLIDKADVFYGTVLSTKINPVKQTHLEFSKIKNQIIDAQETMDNMILGVDNNGEFIFDGSEQEFKEQFTKTSKLINRYNIKAQDFNSIMPEENLSLGENALGLRSVLQALPKELNGLFDSVERTLYSQLLNNQITEASFNAAIQAHYNKTTGRIVNESMPLLGQEMKDLYVKQYIPIDNITSQVMNNTFSVYSEIPDDQKANAKNYVDDSKSPPIYFIDGLNYGTRQETLDILNSRKDKFRADIEEKNEEYKSFGAQINKEPRSYINQLDSSGKWAWEKKEENFTFDGLSPLDPDSESDKDKDGSPDLIQAPKTEKKGTDNLNIIKSILLGKGPRNELIKLFGKENVPKNINSQDKKKKKKLYSDMANSIVNEFKNKNKSIPFIKLQTLNRVPKILDNLNSKLKKD